MFRIIKNGLFCFTFIILCIEKCASDLVPPLPPSLALYAPNSAEYSEVLVRREHDNLTLVCELRGDRKPHRYVWNFLSDTEGDHGPLHVEPTGLTLTSKLTKLNLSVSDSGQYICSAPPFSVTKYLLVQTKGPKQCARGAFWCGARCVLPTYVCDGHRDCLAGEDEAPSLCGASHPCVGADKLNCSSGRCIPEAACCRDVALCRHPYCCDEHPQYSRHVEGFVDVEYPALFEDRHAPDDYGFIQSTIYTVTACALIFMIAVVLLVSAICKMHMKRAALRSYAQDSRRSHRQMFGAARYPPCYEASRLLQQQARVSPPQSQPASPLRDHAACNTASSPVCGEAAAACDESVDEPRSGLSRRGAFFNTRYRQVPTQPPEVEMSDIRCGSLQTSPAGDPPTSLHNYRSPTYCDLNSTDFYFTSPDTADCGRDLNYMATPIEFFRRRTLSRTNPIDRILDQINVNSERPRPLTLQLGRFQLSIPRFGRRSSQDSGRRPDTPNVAEINIDDLDFVRLNSNETYTLNGRTIRLLGANFENYPTVLTDNTVVRPPPYNEAMRYKLYGPPPEYLSRDTLNVTPENNGHNVNIGTSVDEEARSNVEMPPRYEDLASGVDRNANLNGNVASNGDTAINNGNTAICNGNTAISNSNTAINNGNTAMNNDTVTEYDTGVSDNEVCDNATALSGNVNVINGNTLTAVIENLPAIDSDVNANEAITGTNSGSIVTDNGNVIVDNGNE